MKENIFKQINSLEDFKESLQDYYELMDSKDKCIEDCINHLSDKLEGLRNQAKELVTEFLKPGNILKIVAGDGISFREDLYFKVNELDTKAYRIKCDKVTVSHGDYGDSIETDFESIIEFSDIVNLMESHYHFLVSQEEFDLYANFCKTIPEFKEIPKEILK